MPKRKSVETDTAPKKRIHRSLDPEARDNRLINLAYNLVEQRLLDGTATSQEVVHFLKLGSKREEKELQKMDKDILLMESKIKLNESMESFEKQISEAMDAFKNYSGASTYIEEEQDD